MYPAHAPTAELPNRHEFRNNDALNNMTLEPHSAAVGKDQLVEVELEVTERDCENMRSMKAARADLISRATGKYVNLSDRAAAWNLENIRPGGRFVYRWRRGLEASSGNAQYFREYMNDFEIDNLLRAEFDLGSLATPMIYLPVTRTVNAFQSNVELAGYNDYEQKRHLDAAMSRSAPGVVPLAIGRLAQKFRILLEKDTGKARAEFKSDRNLAELTKLLAELGYEWELETTNPLKNAYDVRLKKQGTSFLVGAASSGERELLTYLFAIFALNVRDALIVVDEPELHLHPKWQRTLLQLFARLAKSTGNQFFLATHSPTFISPESIQFISRVYSRNQQSHVLRLSATMLPDAKHLLQIVNSQNNERIFFADEVILVEGLSDRIFFEAVFAHLRKGRDDSPIVEILSVGGKGLFQAYGKLLEACQVPFSIIADRDYLEEIGSEEIQGLFQTDEAAIKKDVIDNIKSTDGKALVQRIENALQTGSWDEARSTWDYIKSRQRRLKESLTDSESETLKAFVAEKRKQRIYILRKGALEDYLPDGVRDKNMDKLIRFVAAADFWSKLSPDVQEELADIAKTVLPT
jgi:hypothetical protein